MTTKFVMFAGDTHGNFLHLLNLINKCKVEGIDTLIVVGDFGYWEHVPEGETFLDALCLELMKDGVQLWWIDGNHENHPMLWEKYGCYDKSREIRPHITYIPRGMTTVIGETRFGFMGGAYSIDKRDRLKRMKRGGPEEWWPTEMITDAQVEAAVQAWTIGPPDIVVSHDAPDGAPMDQLGSVRLDVVREAQALENRERLRTVVETAQPDQIIHGHHHRRMDYQMRLSTGKWVECISLGADVDAYRMAGEQLRTWDGDLKGRRAQELFENSYIILEV